MCCWPGPVSLAMKGTVMINLCRPSIIVPWLVMGSAAYAAIDPTELAIETRCGSTRTVFFGDTSVDIKVSVIVPSFPLWLGPDRLLGSKTAVGLWTASMTCAIHTVFRDP
jgi:hypothetical protein